MCFRHDGRMIARLVLLCFLSCLVALAGVECIYLTPKKILKSRDPMMQTTDPRTLYKIQSDCFPETQILIS